MLHFPLPSLLVCLLLAVTGEARAHVSARVDQELTADDGLQLWLDASRVNAFRKSLNSPEFGASDVMTSWPDGSRSQRVFDQVDEKLRPVLVRIGDAKGQGVFVPRG